MANFAWKSLQNGLNQQLILRYKIKEPNCKPIYAKVDALSLKKLATLFIIITIGFLVALAIYCFEHYFSKNSIEQKNLLIKLQKSKDKVIEDIKIVQFDLEHSGYSDENYINTLIQKLILLKSMKNVS